MILKGLQLKRFTKYILWLYIVLLIGVNWNSINGLGLFIKTYLSYEYEGKSKIQENGPYAEMYDLVEMTSTERWLYISEILDSLGIHYKLDPIGNNQANIFVYGDTIKEMSLITAHYDILERDNYQGALDNSGSTNILINLVKEIDLRSKPVGILFTGMEELGLKGAKDFIKQRVPSMNLKVKEVICLDGIGKGELAVMNNGVTFGFRFRIPFLGEYLFNGSQLRKNPRYEKYPETILDLGKNEIKRLKSYISSTDALVFVREEIPTLHLVSGNIYHFLSVLHTDKDRIESLDQSSMAKCEQILRKYIEEL